MTDLYPLRLTPAPQERIWGAVDLHPYFGTFPNPIGEIWFTFEENIIANGPLAGRTLSSLMTEYGQRLMGANHRPQNLQRRSAGEGAAAEAETAPYFPILTKMLFAEQTLSVQVHPDDAYALTHEGGPGKTELWYVASAREGAAVAIGLTEALSRTEFAEAARSGQIENLLNWVPVSAGDALLIEPGTLHTLGAGISIYEIQQNSDLTYRAFDFGRTDANGNTRELHVDQASDVVRLSNGEPARLTLTAVPDSVFDKNFLAHCPYFEAHSIRWEKASPFEVEDERFQLLMFTEGEGKIGSERYRPGDCFLIPATAEPFELLPEGPSAALLAAVP